MKTAFFAIVATLFTLPALAETVTVCDKMSDANALMAGDTSVCNEMVDTDQLTDNVLFSFFVEEDDQQHEINLIETTDGRVAMVPPKMFF